MYSSGATTYVSTYIIHNIIYLLWNNRKDIHYTGFTYSVPTLFIESVKIIYIKFNLKKKSAYQTLESWMKQTYSHWYIFE